MWNVEDTHVSQLSLSGSGERLVPPRQSEVLELEPVVVGNKVEAVEHVLFPVPVPEIPGLAAGSGRIRINGPQRRPPKAGEHGAFA